MKKILYLFFLVPILLVSQNTIQGTFSPVEDFTYAFLYKVTPTSLMYLDRGKMDETGFFKIELDSTVSAGMYKIVYGVPEQNNNFDFIYDGKEDIILTFSLNEGLDFKESVENKLWESYTKSMELVNMTISSYYQQESTDKTSFKDIFKTLKDTQEAFEDASKGTLAGTFIRANRPYIPIAYEDVSTYSNNLKNTFLTHIDFGNPLLQSSEFLTDRIMAYIFGMTNTNDGYKKHINDVVTAIDNNQRPIIATYLLENIWRKLIELENSEVANYVSNTYLLKLANQVENKELYQSLIAYKHTGLGTIALDFPITYEVDGKAINTSLHELEGSEHYLLVFWSSTCSHCLNELPILQTYLEAHPKDLKVVAFGIEEENENWQKTIPQFSNFIHVLGLGHWDNPTAIGYNINSTPSYFILDKDKKILSKPNDIEALEQKLEGLK